MKLANTIYYGMLHLYNRRSFFFASLMVMVAGIVLIYNTFIVYFGSYSEIVTERNLLKDARDNLYMVKSTYYTMDFSYYDEYRYFLQEMKEDNDIGIYQLTGSCLGDNFDANAMEEIKTKFPDMLDPYGENPVFPILRMDNNLLHILDFQDENGTVITLQKDEKGREEIAVGCDLSPYVNIGDELRDPTGKTVYVVKYILADNQMWINGALLNSTDVVSMANYIITPLDLEKCDSYDCASFAANVFVCVDDKEKSQAESKVCTLQKQAERSGIYVDVCSMEEMEQNSLKENNDEFRFCLLLVGLMVVTVIIIISVLSILSWVSDYHDVGILYANGFVGKDVFRTILVENICKLVLSAAISMAWISMGIWKDSMDLYQDFVYAGVVYAGIVLVYLIVLFLASLVAFTLINRVSPCNLLKGEQL